jgi:hypothetical protein
LAGFSDLRFMPEIKPTLAEELSLFAFQYLCIDEDASSYAENTVTGAVVDQGKPVDPCLQSHRVLH